MDKKPWVEQVEDIIQVLEGSTIGELEMTDGEIEIVIRRSPGMVMAPSPTYLVSGPLQTTHPTMGLSAAPPQQDRSTPIISPITGVYYAAASPSSPSFANVGDVVQIGQVVALVEAMKVFNEITAEVAGRVVKMVAKNGDVVQKGDVILRVEPV